MPETATLATLAREAYDCFESAERPDGSSFTRTRDGTPEWVRELVREAHGPDFLPDDWRYAAIRSALEAIADGEDSDTEDLAHEYADAETDVYTGARFAWLSSNLQRQHYVDQAVSEYGLSDTNIADMVGLGQYAEALEVFELVRGSLESRLADIGAE